MRSHYYDFSYRSVRKSWFFDNLSERDTKIMPPTLVVTVGVSTLVPLFADWIQRRSNGDVYMPDFYLNKYGVPPSLSALSALAASSKLAKPQFAAL